MLLKADRLTEPAFEAAGARRWSYDGGKGRAVNMPCWSIPDKAFDDPEVMARWVRLAYEAALLGGYTAWTRSRMSSSRAACLSSARTQVQGAAAVGARQHLVARGAIGLPPRLRHLVHVRDLQLFKRIAAPGLQSLRLLVAEDVEPVFRQPKPPTGRAAMALGATGVLPIALSLPLLYEDGEFHVFIVGFGVIIKQNFEPLRVAQPCPFSLRNGGELTSEISD